jgi:hypothetical protein
MSVASASRSDVESSERPCQMDSLPPELISEIVSVLRYERASLYSLCLTSKRFLLDARRELYRGIAISVTVSLVPLGCLLLTGSQGDRLFTTFIEFNSSLAQFVHTFIYGERLLDTTRNRSRLIRLAISLELMVNLKNFGYLSTWNVPPVPLGEILQRCTFRLESFQTWRITHSILSPAMLRECLLHQPQLKKLQLLWLKNTPFPDDCCPNLGILAGDCGTIDAILPTARPITHIILSEVSAKSITITPITSQRLRNLHTLCVRSWKSGFEYQMQTLFRHLTGLQVFHYACVRTGPVPLVVSFSIQVKLETDWICDCVSSGVDRI